MIQPRNEEERRQLVRQLLIERFGPMPSPPRRPVPDIEGLRACREARNWSTYEVARRLKISRSLVIGWEQADEKIPEVWARQYAALFDEEVTADA
jgi:ribosome-binding protein aMBF1 (putative translation factor)